MAHIPFSSRSRAIRISCSDTTLGLGFRVLCLIGNDKRLTVDMDNTAKENAVTCGINSTHGL